MTGRDLSKEAAPALHALLKYEKPAFDGALKTAKNAFGRARPFVEHTEDDTCQPSTKHHNAPHKSYPSGHTAAAWRVGLTLAAVMPEKAEAILREAYEMGESRWICGAHWKSDVDAARVLVSSVYARISSEPEFMRLLAEARKEMSENR